MSTKRITIEIADEITRNAMRNKERELSKQKDKLVDWLREERIKTIPVEVMKAYEKHPEYINTFMFFFNINLDISLPNENFRSHSPEQFPHPEKVKKYVNNYYQKKQDLKRITNELHRLVRDCKTINRLKKDYPEFYKFVPEYCITPDAKREVMDVKKVNEIKSFLNINQTQK